MKKIKIALIAHDGKKADMVSFVMKRLNFFNQENIELYSTGTTGKYIKNAGVKKINPMLSGPLGGDAQIASMVAEGNLDAVMFFRDPLGKHPHEPDIQMLMRVCDVYQIPLATNYMTAKLLIDWFEEEKKVSWWHKNKDKKK
jgi:methylglyoxal synthase